MVTTEEAIVKAYRVLRDSEARRIDARSDTHDITAYKMGDNVVRIDVKG